MFKHIVVIAGGVLIASVGVFAQMGQMGGQMGQSGQAAQAAPLPQTTEAIIARALAAAPERARAETTVVRWKPDGTYETLKKGTNRLVCYDRSGEPGRAAFAVQCSSIGNLDRIAQNRKFEAILDKDKRKAALEEAEKNGTRVKPEFGSEWMDMNGPDQEHAHIHRTIAVPGATAQSMGLPDNPKQGGAWIMDAGTTTAHVMIPGT